MEIEEGYIPTSRKKTPREQTISDVLKLDKEARTLNKDDFTKLKEDGTMICQPYFILRTQ